MVVIIILLNGEIMSQSIAIFRTANCAFCSLGAGGRGDGAGFCLRNAAGTAVGVGLGRSVGRVGAPHMVVDGQVLPGEYRQGHPGGFQIFAGGVPRLGVGRAARHQQGQHAAVGKVKSRFFGGGGDGGFAIAVNLSGSAGQVVAVCDGNTIIARPTHNTAQHCICIGSCDTANVITVGNLYGMCAIKSCKSCNSACPLRVGRIALFIDSYSTGVVAIGYTFSPSKPYNAANINR